MSEPVVLQIANGQLAENCYLLGDPASHAAALVDPGEEADRFEAELARGGWRLEAIWLTHAHVDHIMGVSRIRAAHDVPVLLHPADRPLYDALPQQGAWVGFQLDAPPPPDAELSHGQLLRVGPHTWEVRHTPGHSPGSVSFRGHGMILGGDVLFSGSIGRSDLPGGDMTTLFQSIRREFLSLPDDTVVYSGHGPATTIGEERTTNPFLTGAVHAG